MIIFGSPVLSNTYSVKFGQLAPHIKPVLRNLGVLFNIKRTLEKQINTIIRNSFFNSDVHQRSKKCQRLVCAFVPDD